MEKDFTAMINQHRATIYKVCNLYAGSEGNRSDLFQEIVLQLWKSYPSFRNESKENTWIYRVAINTAITNFRREYKRIDKQSITWDHLEIPEVIFDSQEKDKMDQLSHAISQLNEIEKAIILLYLEDKSYEEISAILGISLSNAGVRLNRIKTKLTNIIHKTSAS